MSKKKNKQIKETNIEGKVKNVLQLKFITDASLGKVAKFLRMVGLDVYYDKNCNSHYLLYIARTQHRIIITKNRALVHQLIALEQQKVKRMLKKQSKIYSHSIEEMKEFFDKQNVDEEIKNSTFEWIQKRLERRKQYEEMKKEKQRKEKKKTTDGQEEEDLLDENSDEEEFEEEDDIDDGEEDNIDLTCKYYFLQHRKYEEQVRDVVKFFGIEYDESKLFSRCLICNSHIFPIENKDEIKDSVFPSVFAENEQFYRCSGCKKIYWGRDKTHEHVNFVTAKEYAKRVCEQAINEKKLEENASGISDIPETIKSTNKTKTSTTTSTTTAATTKTTTTTTTCV